jgi:hypothetical protein
MPFSEQHGLRNDMGELKTIEELEEDPDVFVIEYSDELQSAEEPPVDEYGDPLYVNDGPYIELPGARLYWKQVPFEKPPEDILKDRTEGLLMMIEDFFGIEREEVVEEDGQE